MQSVFHHIFISRVWERCQGLLPSGRRAIASAELHQAFADLLKSSVFFQISLLLHFPHTVQLLQSQLSKENLVFTSGLKPSYLLYSVNLQLVPTAGFCPCPIWSVSAFFLRCFQLKSPVTLLIFNFKKQFSGQVKVHGFIDHCLFSLFTKFEMNLVKSFKKAAKIAGFTLFLFSFSSAKHATDTYEKMVRNLRL